METRLRDDRAQWKARISSLASEREGVLQSGRGTFEEKSKQIEQLEEQVRAQAVAHETRRREIVHQATLKSRTLQDIIHQIEQELKSSQELLPQQIQEREATIAKLQENLAAAQVKHERTLARFERALATLERRGRKKKKRSRDRAPPLRKNGPKSSPTGILKSRRSNPICSPKKASARESLTGWPNNSPKNAFSWKNPKTNSNGN